MGQKAVRKNFLSLATPQWKVLDASRDMGDLSEECLQLATAAIDAVGEKAVGTLWGDAASATTAGGGATSLSAVSSAMEAESSEAASRTRAALEEASEQLQRLKALTEEALSVATQSLDEDDASLVLPAQATPPEPS